MLPKHVIFEGIDGTGKDTQIEMLALNAQTKGKEVLFLRTPTGGRDEGFLRQWHTTPSGQLLRKMWSYYPVGDEDGYDPEFIHAMTGPIFLADMFELDARCWHTGWNPPKGAKPEVQEPSKNFVIQSRSWASTYAYQHNQPQTQNAALAAAEVLKAPNVWIYLHQDIQITLDRIAARAVGGKAVQEGLYEREGRLRKTKETFEQLFLKNWEESYGEVLWIRADQPAQDVHSDIMTGLTARGIL
jgi:thymidylate kinase